MTDYNLETASIEEKGNDVIIYKGGSKVKYSLEGLAAVKNDELKKTVGDLDRAYSILGSDTRVTHIQREKWPIQEVNCKGFQNTFFKTARFEGAFRVFETIYYDWLPPTTIAS